MQSITNFVVSAVNVARGKIGVTTIGVSWLTCDLPLGLVNFHSSWEQFSEVTLADLGFGQSCRVDLLLGVEVFTVMLHGWRYRPPDSPTAFETRCGWVLAVSVANCASA